MIKDPNLKPVGEDTKEEQTTFGSENQPQVEKSINLPTVIALIVVGIVAVGIAVALF